VEVVAEAVVGAEVAEEEAEVEEFPQVCQPSPENWEATHKKNSTETGRKANPSYSTSSSIEE